MCCVRPLVAALHSANTSPSAGIYSNLLELQWLADQSVVNHQLCSCLIYSIDRHRDSRPCGRRPGCSVLRSCSASHPQEDDPHRPGGRYHRCRPAQLTSCHHGWLPGIQTYTYTHVHTVVPPELPSVTTQQLKAWHEHFFSLSGHWVRATHQLWEKLLQRYLMSTGRTSEDWTMSRENFKNWFRWEKHTQTLIPPDAAHIY